MPSKSARVCKPKSCSPIGAAARNKKSFVLVRHVAANLVRPKSVSMVYRKKLSL